MLQCCDRVRGEGCYHPFSSLQPKIHEFREFAKIANYSGGSKFNSSTTSPYSRSSRCNLLSAPRISRLVPLSDLPSEEDVASRVRPLKNLSLIASFSSLDNFSESAWNRSCFSSLAICWTSGFSAELPSSLPRPIFSSILRSRDLRRTRSIDRFLTRKYASGVSSLADLSGCSVQSDAHTSSTTSEPSSSVKPQSAFEFKRKARSSSNADFSSGSFKAHSTDQSCF